MVKRSHRIFCNECGMPVKYLENRRRVVWMEEHKCDPKRKLEWKVKVATGTQYKNYTGNVPRPPQHHPYKVRQMLNGGI